MSQTLSELKASSAKNETIVLIYAGNEYNSETIQGIALQVYMKSKKQMLIAQKNIILKVKRVIERVNGKASGIKYQVYQGQTLLGQVAEGIY